MRELIKKYKLGAQHANKKVKWGAWPSFFVSIGAYIIPTAVLAVAVAIVAIMQGAEEPGGIIDSGNYLQTLLLSVFIAFGAISIVFRYVRDKGGIKALGIDSFKKKRTEYLKLGLAAYGVYFVSFFAILFLISLFSPGITEEAQELGVDDPAGLLNHIYVFLLLVVLPPIYEEVLFRGFFFQGVAKALGFLPAALAVNGLFGLAHRQLNVGIDTFILGIIASWLVWKTKSLWPAIALHAIKNLVAYTFRFVLT